MRDKTIRTVGATVILLGIAIAAVAQMGGPDGEPSAIALVSEPDTTTSTAAPSTTTTKAPFVYRVGVLADITTDNYWAFYGEEPSVWNSYILGPTKPALFRIDAATGSLVPELATRMAEPTRRGSSWVVNIELNESFSWSDGEPVTADDFAFTFETVRELDLGGSWAMAFPEAVDGIEADGPHTLSIEFSSRPTLSDWPHAVGTAPVMPAHVWGTEIEGRDKQELYELGGASDVGGGPLAITARGEGLIQSISNPGYPFTVGPDQVEYRTYEDEQAAAVALEYGEIDTVLTPSGLSSESIGELRGTEGVAFEGSRANSIRYLGFNLEREPMSEPAFRSALALLLDRQGLANQAEGGAEVPHSFVSEGSGIWHDPQKAADNYGHLEGELGDRLNRALEGLIGAGYEWETPPTISGGEITAGTGLTVLGVEPAPLTILTPGEEYDEDRPRYATAIAETLGLLGFDARPVVTDFDTVVDLTFSTEDDVPQYDMYLLGWTLGNPALPDYYRPLFSKNGDMNNTGYSNKAFQAALARYEQAFSQEDAKQALWAMESQLAKDLPYLLLYSSQMTEAYRSDRVEYGIGASIGGLQGRLGGIGDVHPSS